MMLKAKPPRLDFHLDGAVILFDFWYSLRENMSKSKNHFGSGALTHEDGKSYVLHQ